MGLATEREVCLVDWRLAVQRALREPEVTVLPEFSIRGGGTVVRRISGAGERPIDERGRKRNAEQARAPQRSIGNRHIAGG